MIETFISVNLLDIESKLFFNYIFASRSKLLSPCHIKIKLKNASL